MVDPRHRAQVLGTKTGTDEQALWGQEGDPENSRGCTLRTLQLEPDNPGRVWMLPPQIPAFARLKKSPTFLYSEGAVWLIPEGPQRTNSGLWGRVLLAGAPLGSQVYIDPALRPHGPGINGRCHATAWRCPEAAAAHRARRQVQEVVMVEKSLGCHQIPALQVYKECIHTNMCIYMCVYIYIWVVRCASRAPPSPYQWYSPHHHQDQWGRGWFYTFVIIPL